MRSFKAWQPKHDFRIAKADGTPATTDVDERIAINEHFQAKFEATDNTFADILTWERENVGFRAEVDLAVPRELEAIPTLSYLLCRHAHSKMNGPGELMVGG